MWKKQNGKNVRFDFKKNFNLTFFLDITDSVVQDLLRSLQERVSSLNKTVDNKGGQTKEEVVTYFHLGSLKIKTKKKRTFLLLLVSN